jgi:hypothetical protein
MPPFVMHIPGSPADHRSLMQLACITRGGQACWALLEGFSLLAFDPDMQARCITAEREPQGRRMCINLPMSAPRPRQGRRLRASDRLGSVE